ncbi:hypothetical protein V5799_014391 [Amblyomma americanum]|uniref:Uncharacterized protein n=1 Tax=Amblyomma americanum TaxID=6943 RepID=A0AAQ4E379_AMBAM
MAQQLAGIGGNTPQSVTTRILARMMHNSLGQKYSLYGKKGVIPAHCPTELRRNEKTTVQEEERLQGSP